ncbi:glycosyltransferase family 2 protein [Blastococcus xanthinilyticus]|uniref:Glycosyltransferase involved in cell wall biosynthesis n=1 Tax=Blastococcus xanthinilyticus TaxID=1564164 RepID=A0A5S5D1E4_9ACTN|nr:glycosyltransferase family 2 protein [Blastococcus xanthinilyticus]TYP89831.1 glycosyltransferase involved in cell wall biosynthesis [Blastococcus xanthinilyticus]
MDTHLVDTHLTDPGPLTRQTWPAATPQPAGTSEHPAVPATDVTYSVVVPVYGNEATIPALLDRLATLSGDLDGEMEAVFVVDGSPDASLLVLRRLLPESGLRAQLVTLSRNYGAFSALRAGLAVAEGRYTAVMAADLQEPVSLVQDIFAALSTGEFDVAVGVRSARNDPALSSVASRTFWSLYRRFVHKDLPVGGVDMFGCTRQVVTELLRLEESHTSLVGLLYWLGFRRAEIPYVRQEREHGKSGWTLRKKLRYMSDSIFSFTDLPITVLITAGVLGVVLSVVAGIAVFAAWATGNVQVQGYTPLMLMLFLLCSSILLALGIVGSYVWRTYENSKHRPGAVPMHHERFPAGRG